MYFNIIIAAAPASISIRPIPNFPEYYATADGQIVSLRRNQMRILKPVVRQNGYLAVKIKRSDGRTMDRYVHQLVCEAYHGPKPSPDHVVAHHPSPIKSDCQASNVMWASRSENTAHWLATNPSVHGGPKLDAVKVRELRKLKAAGWSSPKLAARYDIGMDCVRKAYLRETWKHVA